MSGFACIGWGSLIWDPRDLPLLGQWCEDGPWLSVEFLRQSSGDRLTLVLCDGSKPVRAPWSLLDVSDLDAAACTLRDREGFKTTKWIGRWPSAEVDLVTEAIGLWAVTHQLDGVVWTAAPPKWNDANGVAPTLDEALAWLGGLGDRAARAREYVERAPGAVRTPYREAFEQKLGWYPQPDEPA